jgi:glycosyltransferase involved in cell wall biosynthesis
VYAKYFTFYAILWCKYKLAMVNVEVSLISTVFNGQRYIGRAVDSILEQEHPDFEWVIVDDGSDDQTVARLQKRVGNDPRVRIFTPGRLGRARALNYAVARAQGSYIANHDFDDISYPNRLGVQVPVLEDNPDVGVVGGDHVAVDENRGERYVRRQPRRHDQIVRAMSRYIPVAHTVATFRKEAWEEVGGYPVAENAIDMRFWMRLINAGWKMRNPPEVLGEHFIYSDSFWNENFNYAYRQFDLALLNARVIRDQNLPFWMYMYPLSRLFYGGLPPRLKRYARRLFGGSNEEDL